MLEEQEFPKVAPRVGAWIETVDGEGVSSLPTESLPAWERGLKLVVEAPDLGVLAVAPRVGAWIETADWLTIADRQGGRSPRGSVD